MRPVAFQHLWRISTASAEDGLVLRADLDQNGRDDQTAKRGADDPEHCLTEEPAEAERSDQHRDREETFGILDAAGLRAAAEEVEVQHRRGKQHRDGSQGNVAVMEHVAADAGNDHGEQIEKGRFHGHGVIFRFGFAD